MPADLTVPNYPPAIGFKQPTLMDYQLHIDSASVADLLGSPATRAVVLKHLPGVAMVTKVPAFEPNLSNMTLANLALFLPGMTPEALAAVDAELRKLPRKDWPNSGR